MLTQQKVQNPQYDTEILLQIGVLVSELLSGINIESSGL